jgi:nicotinate-nucleotide adenylyltransferase
MVRAIATHPAQQKNCSRPAMAARNTVPGGFGSPQWKQAEALSAGSELSRAWGTVVATASNPRFTVSRVDIDRPGPTFTIDTLRDLRGQRPDAELFFITGADALAQILSWKDADELFDLAHFIGVTRPGYVLSESGLPADRVTLQEVPAMAISSTDCRARVERAEPVWYLVPDGVVQYVNKYRLYAAGSPAGAPART